MIEIWSYHECNSSNDHLVIVGVVTYVLLVTAVIDHSALLASNRPKLFLTQVLQIIIKTYLKYCSPPTTQNPHASQQNSAALCSKSTQNVPNTTKRKKRNNKTIAWSYCIHYTCTHTSSYVHSPSVCVYQTKLHLHFRPPAIRQLPLFPSSFSIETM